MIIQFLRLNLNGRGGLNDMIKLNPLYKRLKREFFDNFGRYLAISIMLISTIAIISAFLAVASAVEQVVNRNKSENLIEDGQFTLLEELNTNVENALEEIGVNVYKNYHINLKFNENTTLRVYKVREEVNLVDLMEGQLPVSKYEIAIDRLFAKNNRIKIGDIVNGLQVTGFVALSDYSSLFEHNNDLIMDSFHFGVGVVKGDTFETLGNATGIQYNYSYRNSSPLLTTRESFELSKEMITILQNNNMMLSSFTIAENNQSISFFSEDMGSDVPVMKVLLYIILVVMAFVFTVLIKHTIESEAPIIGTLLASGYTKNEIVLHYMSMPIIVTLVSAFIGNLLGYTIMLKPFKSLYYNNYSLPPCNVTINYEALVITTVLPVIMIAAINFIALRKQLSITPLRFLRRDLKKTSRSNAVKLPNFSFLSRFRIRVILQNKSSYIMLFIGIFMASFLLLFGLSLMPLIDHYTDTIDDTMLAKYQYILKAPIEVENAEKATFASLKVSNYSNVKDLEVSLYGLDNFEGYQWKENDIYFSESIFHKLGVSREDELEFIDEFTEKSYKLRASDDIYYTAGFAVFMSREKLNELLGYQKGYYNCYLTDHELEIEETYIAKLITSEDITKIATQMMSSFGGMMKPVVIMSIMIYLVLMYILTKLAIDKNTLSISYLKVFGYEDLQIRKIYLHSGTITVIASLILCLPLESIAAKSSILAAMNKSSGYIEPFIPWYLYVIIVVIGLLSYFVINTFHVIKVNHINMTEAMKSRE